jgi:hypothetical protein
MIESIPEFRTMHEYSHALRPENVVLRKPLSDQMRYACYQYRIKGERFQYGWQVLKQKGRLQGALF